MKMNSVTVGVPVSDLGEAITWYTKAFELGDHDLEPDEGMVEFYLDAFWLQLFESPSSAGSDGMAVNISVENATAERERFIGLGLHVSEIRRIEGVVEFFQLTDPDNNAIGFVTELD